MKAAARSMTPKEAATAFYGQDQAAFDKMVEALSSSDPRLAKVFQDVRERFLETLN